MNLRKRWLIRRPKRIGFYEGGQVKYLVGYSGREVVRILMDINRQRAEQEREHG